MLGFRPRLHVRSEAFKRSITPSNKTMCWDQYCADGEKCCHAMDLGMSYCCTEYSGFVFLGLILGGGVTIALLIVTCYLCMRRAERRLEEEAKLHALKTLSSTVLARASGNNSEPGNATNPSPSTPNTVNTSNHNHPPPAYEQVIAPDYLLNNLNHVRQCRTCDPHQVHTSCMDYQDVTALVARSLSESNSCRYSNYDPPTSTEIPPQAKYYNLPPLPPVSGSIDKLPTYNECTSHLLQNLQARENTAHSPYSETISGNSNMDTPSDQPVEIWNETRTSSLRRPICIPIGHQQQNTNNCGLGERLSTPTQVDDGTGIVFPVQTGTSPTSVGESRDQVPTSDIAVPNQPELGGDQEQVPPPSQIQTCMENKEHVSDSVSAASALHDSLEEEKNDTSTSATYESESNDSDHEGTLTHNGSVVAPEGNVRNENDAGRIEN